MDNNPRWMMTFADLMTLLLCLFVLILSLSHIDNDAFAHKAGELNKAFGLQFVIKNDEQASKSSVILKESDLAAAPRVDREEIIAKIRSTLASQVASGLIDIEQTESAIIIRFPDHVAFSSGSDDLQDAFIPVIAAIAKVLAEAPGEISVSGHTDDIPISTERFRSNWELSSARALAVTHQILEHADVSPSRITAQGHADGRPLVPNNTPQNRAKNRRVEISLDFTK